MLCKGLGLALTTSVDMSSSCSFTYQRSSVKDVRTGGGRVEGLRQMRHGGFDCMWTFTLEVRLPTSNFVNSGCLRSITQYPDAWQSAA